MIASALYADLYPQLSSKITDEQVREALAYLIGRSSFLRDFDCHPQLKGPDGPMMDFRFIRKSDQQQPFALIAAKDYLRFYFRSPSMRDPRYSLADLQARFDSAEDERKSKEWTIKLRSVDDVRRLWDYLNIA